MRGAFFLTTLLAIATSASLAQNKAAPAKKSTPPTEISSDAKLLLERAQLLTNEIEEDAPKLDPDQQMILPARLAEVWRQADPARAKAWKAEAIMAVEVAPQNESAEQRRARLLSAGQMLGDVVQSDPATADRLLETMLDGISGIHPKSSSKADADLYMQVKSSALTAEMRTVRDQPQRALQMLDKILPVDNLSGILFQNYIGFKDSPQPELAEQMVQNALATARATGSTSLIGDLSMLATTQPNIPEKYFPPEATRRQIADFVGQWMVRVPQNEEEHTQICRFAGGAARLLPVLSPELQGQTQAVIAACKQAGLVSPAAEHSAETFNKSPDEVLSTASQSADVRQRALDKINSAMRLANSDPLRALAIFDKLSDEERAAWPGWQRSRSSVAGMGIVKFEREADLASARKIVDSSPHEQKPQLLEQYSSAAERLKDPVGAVSALREARQLLQHVDLDDNWQPWITLLNRYARLMPEEAPFVAREAMAGWDKTKTYTRDEAAKKGRALSTQSPENLSMISLDPTVAEIDPQAMDAAVKLLNSPARRTVMRLSLARLVLQRYLKLTAVKTAAKP